MPTQTLISNRCQMPNSGKSSGSYQTVSYRSSHWSTQAGAARSIRLVYSNMYNDTTGEADGETTDILIKAAIEVGSVYKRVFFRGRRIATVEPGGFVVSDPIGIEIPANTQFWVRTRMACNNLGEKWPCCPATIPAIGEAYATTPADQADGTGVLTNWAAANVVAPTAILGTLVASAPKSVVIIGSSSAYGQGDTAEAPHYEAGYLSRIVTNKVGSLKLTRPSQTAAMWTADASRRLALLEQLTPTDCIWQLGTNDITNGVPVDTIKADMLAAWNALAALGIRIWATTFTPVATSSDSWATEANQSLTANNTNRVAINNWIRSTPAPLTGFLEIADVVENVRDGGKWKVTGAANGFTADGQHLSLAAHRLVAASFPAGTMGL